jgi:UPF0176 protein
MEPRVWTITSFYRFSALDPAQLPKIRASLLQEWSELSLKGLLILAPEGLNGTLAGSKESIQIAKKRVLELLQHQETSFKDSESESAPFKRLTIDVRPEIVSLKKPEVFPNHSEHHHLTAIEWHEMLQSAQPKILIDTRNHYEASIGKFKGAIDPGITAFHEWGDYLDQANLPKDVPIMIYCTGGIRCEKAILEMESRGFNQVVQLRDGILGYLAEYPNCEFEGECYVFDDRLAVDQHLNPSQNYGICPGCGGVGTQKLTCQWCGETYFACEGEVGEWRHVCSKTCRDRLRRHGSPKTSVT